MLSDLIREKIGLHRRFADTNWALRADTLTELESVRMRFEPEDAVRRNAWLFRPRWQLSETPEGEAERLDVLCPQAVRDIVDEGGWQAILRLVDAAEAPEEVGSVLATIGLAGSDGDILPGAPCIGGGEGGSIRRRIRQKEIQGTGVGLGQWAGDDVVGPQRRLDNSWSSCHLNARPGRSSRSTATRSRRCTGDTPGLTFAERTAKMRRLPLRCSSSMEGHRRRLRSCKWRFTRRAIIRPDLLMDALEAWIKPEMGGIDTHQVTVLQIQLLVQELQRRAAEKDQSVDLDRLATLEWGYLGLLDGHPASPVTLHRKLRDDPDFFVDVLGLVFRPKNRPVESGEDISEADRKRAQNGYRLLSSWQDVPGGRGGQGVDEKSLSAWVQKARSKADDRGLLEICDSRIGEIFAYAPEEDDGSWPCVPVRDALEEIGTDEVFQGLAAGIYNKRGTVWKSSREGGAQERLLAEKYRKSADASKIEWPRTAATLRRIADGYEDDGRREDVLATID